MNLPALLILVSSPSGAGKTTLCQRLLAEFPELHFSVSTTTRPMRGGEVDGVDYHFVDDAEFDRLVAANAFVEWAGVHGRRYGTTWAEVETRRSQGGVLFDVDVQGARQIKSRYPETATILILPPSMEELERRIRGRGLDAEEQVVLRLANARREVESWPQFDFLVVNDDVDRAFDLMRSIVLAEASRREHRAEDALKLLS
jgi:guanylate kinase